MVRDLVYRCTLKQRQRWSDEGKEKILGNLLAFHFMGRCGGPFISERSAMGPSVSHKTRSKRARPSDLCIFSISLIV